MMKKPFKDGWHVLYVRSRHEKKVAHLLTENNFESFLPVVKATRKWSDREKVIHTPLFPSYIFVKITSPTDFYRALTIKGATSYIHFGNEYAIVKEKEIKKIKLLIASDDIINIGSIAKLPESGEIKRITFGSLKGLECEILRAKDEMKILVRIDSVKQNIIATIPLNYLSEKSVMV